MILDFRFLIFDLSKKAFLMFCLSIFAFTVFGQEQPPEPSSPRALKIPKIVEDRLPNGMRVVVVERRNVPLVSVNLMINRGASFEDSKLAGLMNMTANLMTKGTKTRNANAIAEQTEFLGSSIGAGANWYATDLSFNSTTDKLDQMMSIFSDVVLNPSFPQAEMNLYKSQTIDELQANLKQPGTLARYVAAQYTFGEHSVQGTPETIKAITRNDLLKAYKNSFNPVKVTLIFTGDISKSQAVAITKKYFGMWKPIYGIGNGEGSGNGVVNPMTIEQYRQMMFEKKTLNRMLVIDLPDSGQAAVVYARDLSSDEFGDRFGKSVDRSNDNYYVASVANSLLGGGYSSRLNQEIRIKRGLSYGAGSSIAWRWGGGNFATRCQTKNVSAAEVAELTMTEINRLINENASDSELTPRKNVFNGNFGRNFETNEGISNQVEELLTFEIEFDDLNSFMSKVDKVSASQVKDFALFNLKGGDLIIVGDYKVFKDDLAKRFPNQKVEVIKASELNLNSNTLR